MFHTLSINVAEMLDKMQFYLIKNTLKKKNKKMSNLIK